MKKLIDRITARGHIAALEAKEKIRDDRGNFFMDHAVVFVLIIVIGGIVLALLTTYIQNDLATTIKSKISDFFT